MNMHGYVIRYDELALKGKNRKRFEQKLIENIKTQLSDFDFKVEHLWGRLFLRTSLDFPGFRLDSQRFEKRLSEIFGISSFSPVTETESDVEKIKGRVLQLVVAYLEQRKNRDVKFRISTNRVNKKFEPKSPEMNRLVAEHVLQHIASLGVDLKEPDLDVGIEIREDVCWIHLQRIEGSRGLPVGSSGKVLTLLSGGIDSPVAAWHMMRRGCPVEFIHFFSYPYTSLQSKEKVLDLTKSLGRFQRDTNCHVVSFTHVQEAIQKACHERYRTILYRRFMQRIATRVAGGIHALALVTGESLGQVASQTLENISVISQSTDMLLLRPLIGFNKQEIVNVAKKIGTFELSIQPFDDCCTVFQSKIPATTSKLHDLLRQEEKLDVMGLVNEAIEKTTLHTL